jgi:hypothetical protein
MIIVLAENYSESLIPNPCLRTHFDGISYYFAQTQEDVDAIEAMFPVIDSTPDPQVGTALQAVLSATPEELEEIKKILGIM